jgi:hypothetical protein
MNKSTIGGILTIVASSLSMLSAIGIVLMAFWLVSLLRGAAPITLPSDIQAFNFVSRIIYLEYFVIAFVVFILSALGIVGGIFAIKQRVWGLALAGAIAASMTLYPIGIVAVIMVSMARPEFATTPTPINNNLER